jgi:hypothetical protein
VVDGPIGHVDSLRAILETVTDCAIPFTQAHERGTAMPIMAGLRRCVVVFALACTVNATAQEELETITVVGSRISYRDLLDTPAISLTRPGDWLSLELTLFNDTRNEDLRKQELYATIRTMVERADPRFEVVFPENYVGKLDATNYEVELKDDAKREDASKVTLVVRTRVEGGSGKAGEALIAALRSFIKSSAKSGRTEIELAKETGLSMIRPERYRYELLEAIAEDAAKVRARFGTGCRVALSGLNSRIEWERVSATELMLYIPYTMDVTDCGNVAASPAST